MQAGRAAFAFGIFVAGGFLVEYAWPGIALVLATWAAARSPRPGAADLGAVALALVGLCLLVNGNAWALFAVPVALALAWLRPEVPRLRWWFWWFYPVHLALLVSLRWL